MAEKNVTPAVADLWADDNDEPSHSQKPETDIHTTQNRENCITGETFLKDARQVDQSIENMQAIANSVNLLEKPYNDNEESLKPAN